jgi:hypothetical protein
VWPSFSAILAWTIANWPHPAAATPRPATSANTTVCDENFRILSPLHTLPKRTAGRVKRPQSCVAISHGPGGQDGRLPQHCSERASIVIRFLESQVVSLLALTPLDPTSIMKLAFTIMKLATTSLSDTSRHD